MKLQSITVSNLEKKYHNNIESRDQVVTRIKNWSTNLLFNKIWPFNFSLYQYVMLNTIDITQVGNHQKKTL